MPNRRVVGFLGAATAEGWRPWIAAFVQRLDELGWVDGRTVAIEYRWAEGRSVRYAEIAAEFVELRADAIVTAGAAVAALRQATSTIPIVFAVANDPLGGGLVASLSRPGGNVTGLSVQASELGSKRLEFLRELLPGVHTLAIMANPGYRAAALEMNQMQALARTLGMEVTPLEIRRAEDIAPAVDKVKGRVAAIYVCADSFADANGRNIIDLARSARIPTMHHERYYVDRGALISYGPDHKTMFRRAAEFVDKILHGTNPGDIPVEQATRFDLVINTATAKTLGLKIPDALLARADDLIE
jgi:putative tryptophan/tyrosine transport system substrate-binding protein